MEIVLTIVIMTRTLKFQECLIKRKAMREFLDLIISCIRCTELIIIVNYQEINFKFLQETTHIIIITT